MVESSGGQIYMLKIFADGIIASIKSNQKVGSKIFNLSSDKSNFKISIAFAAKKVFKKSKINIQKSMFDAKIIGFVKFLYHLVSRQKKQLIEHIKISKSYSKKIKILTQIKKFIAIFRS